MLIATIFTDYFCQLILKITLLEFYKKQVYKTFVCFPSKVKFFNAQFSNLITNLSYHIFKNNFKLYNYNIHKASKTKNNQSLYFSEKVVGNEFFYIE